VSGHHAPHVLRRVRAFADDLARNPAAASLPATQAAARSLAHDLALLYQAWLLARFAPGALPGLTELWLATRLAHDAHGGAAGPAGPNAPYGAWAASAAPPDAALQLILART
jgi:hypothetical protein